ncbi:MAG: PIN domain-containing protein [Candidatus Thermoplasmatota archaeon]|nr:PIN domain-containing protein [Candidatus Thermoplasmatota archaeon]
MSGIKTCIDTNVFLNVIHSDPSFYSYSRKILSAIDRGIAGVVESGPADA